jgi:Trk K+ transport system NAD-binding subunit
MTDNERQSAHTIIAGFGVPGRVVAELLESRGIPYTVIETNPTTVNRAGKPGRELVCGNACDEAVLRHAGIETATLLVIAIPNESAALDATRLARKLNPTIHIITRTHFTSVGMEARQAGANEVVVEEQAVAHEFSRLLSQNLNTHMPHV